MTSSHQEQVRQLSQRLSQNLQEIERCNRKTMDFISGTQVDVCNQQTKRRLEIENVSINEQIAYHQARHNELHSQMTAFKGYEL